MISRLALWLALRIVWAVAMLVPASARPDWRREWDAELQHYAANVRRRRNLSWRTDMNLLRRALGSLPDAAWIRRQFTLDADAVHDTIHGVRMLLKTPGFTAIALLVFALGIGATTAMVSVADALLMRDLPVADADRVMTIWQFDRDTGVGQEDVAPGNALDWIKRARSFESIAAAEPWAVISAIPGREPEVLSAARVSDQFFTVLRIPMIHGRTFLPQEYERGGPRVAILGYGMWSDRFGGNPAIVGQAVRLDNGDPYTIVGVLPRDFELRLFDDRARRPEPMVWLPRQGDEARELTARGRGYWNVIARLGPGVPIEQARAEFDTLSAQLARENPQSNRNIAAQIVPLRSHLVGSLRAVLPVLLGAAAILLIVACANVANLLLARGIGRGREFAVRQALGAGRGRLARQMLMESLLLAVAGGAAGLALARWALDVIARLRPMDVGRLDHLSIDVRAALIALGVTILAALAAGLMPSIQLSRPAAARALHDRRSSSHRGARAALVILEIAAAVVLTVGAGLLVRSFMLVQRVDPGFSRDDVAVLQVFTFTRYRTPERRIVFIQQVLDRMRVMPGVVAAGAVSSMPFGETRIDIRGPLAITGRLPLQGEQALIHMTTVAGDSFRAMGVPLIAGRPFEVTDTAGARKVVLVSQDAARRFWPDANPIGSTVQFQFSDMSYDAEVVGVVGDVRHEGLDLPPRAELFLPHAQSGFGGMTLVVRTAPGSPVTLQALKGQIRAIDPQQLIYHTATLEQLISRTLVGRRFSLFLLGGFALATLLLTSAGVYGVMSCSTSQRTREFGVRLALGAKRHDIVRLVLGEGLKLTAVGVIAGVVVALPLTGLLRGMLFGVVATDPLTFLVVSLALVLVAAAACYVPARRALQVHPAEALRAD